MYSNFGSNTYSGSLKKTEFPSLSYKPNVVRSHFRDGKLIQGYTRNGWKCKTEQLMRKRRRPKQY